MDSYNQAYFMGQWIGWTVDFHGQSSLSHVTLGQDSRICKAPVGQWILMECPTSSLGQWDRTDSGLPWTIPYVLWYMGSHWILMTKLDIYLGLQD